MFDDLAWMRYCQSKRLFEADVGIMRIQLLK